MKKYYDFEYDRVVEEKEVEKQYNWFVKNQNCTQSFEEFANENFREIKEESEIEEHHADFERTWGETNLKNLY